MARPPLNAAERLARRTSILDAADALLNHDGLLALQIATIARRSGCSTGTIYQHFASKEDLLLGLTARDLRLQTRVFEQIMAIPARPRDQMMALALADHRLKSTNVVRFGLRQYTTTQVVWAAASESARQEVLEAGSAIGDMLEQLVIAAIDCGDIPAIAPRSGHGTKPPAATDASCHPYSIHTIRAISTGPWALLIGLQTLMNARGLLEFYAVQSSDELLFDHFDALLDGLGWQPLSGIAKTADTREDNDIAADASAADARRIQREAIERRVAPLLAGILDA
ncbi:MAG: TetR/AcrR family transcriptional regulator [Thioalkalivibrionaceae bacterium]